MLKQKENLNLALQLKELENQEQTKLKVCRRKGAGR